LQTKSNITFYANIAGVARGYGPLKFLAYTVILCFEGRCSQTQHCCSPEVETFGPHQNYGLATPLSEGTTEWS